MPSYALHHVQVAIPPDGEDAARAFYGELLGLKEVRKPVKLAGRGGCWFRSGSLEIHLGVQEPFVAASKAHPGILLRDGFDDLVRRLNAAGVRAVPDDNFPGFRRVYVADPFGNRVELMTPHSDSGAVEGSSR